MSYLYRLRFGAIKIEETTYRYLLLPPSKPDEDGYSLSVYCLITGDKFFAVISVQYSLIIRSLELFISYRFVKDGHSYASFSGTEQLELLFGSHWIAFTHLKMDDRDFLMEELIQEKKSTAKQINNLNTEITNIRTEHNTTISKLKAELSTIDHHHNAAITNLKADLTQAINQLGVTERTERDAAIDALRTQLMEIKSTIEKQHETSIRSLRTELTTTINQQITNIDKRDCFIKLSDGEANDSGSFPSWNTTDYIKEDFFELITLTETNDCIRIKQRGWYFVNVRYVVGCSNSQSNIQLYKSGNSIAECYYTGNTFSCPTINEPFKFEVGDELQLRISFTEITDDPITSAFSVRFIGPF